MEQPAQTYRAHARAIWVLGMPLILSNMAQFAVQLTDTIMLGWYDVTALAASTIAGTLYFLVFIVGAGFAHAVTPMVAAAAEKKDDTQVRRVTRMGLWLSILYGAVLMTSFFFTEQILLAIGQDPDVAALAHIYAQIILFQMIPALMVMTLKSFFSALEHTAVILAATIIMALSNAALNYVLIFGNFGAPELGIRGAGIASVTVTLINLLIFVVYIAMRLKRFTLFQNFTRSDTEILSKVFRLGWPIGLTYLAEAGMFSASAIMMGWMGSVSLAAHGIAVQLASLTFMVHIGFSQAATVRAGRAIGRNDGQGLRRGGWTAIGMSALFSLITSAVFLAFPEALVSLFIDPTDPDRIQLIQIGAALIMVAALFQLVDGAQALGLGVLRGMQDTTVPMVYAGVSYWCVGLPASYLLAFPFGYGSTGLWLGLVLGLAVAAALLIGRFFARSAQVA